MKLTPPTNQLPGGPINKPIVVDPVMASLDIPLFYATENGIVPWHHEIFCSRAFAETVLATLEALLLKEKLGLVHVGIYNPRYARHKDGTPIKPVRWSNHAWGEAIDFKGVIIPATDFFRSIATMKKWHFNQFNNITEGCSTAITSIGRRPEIVDEGDWLHVGIWPKNIGFL